MTMSVGIHIAGTDQVVARLAKASSEAEVAALGALYTQAQRTLTKAVKYTPIDTGVLRASGHVVHTGVSIDIIFGGPTAPYAVVVHENLGARHAKGTQAKYLERAFMEDQSKYIAAIAAAYKKQGIT